MHIPDQMLNGAVCPVTLTAGAVAVGAAFYFLKYSEDKVSDLRWAGVSALIFIMQMLNVPVASGTSGHLLGGVLAASTLGIPRGILTISYILLIQAVLFADGGISALGANVLNMAVIGAGLGGFIYHTLNKRGLSQDISLALASWASVVLAAVACTVEAALSGAVDFGAMFNAMVPVHARIGFAEAILTVVCFRVFALMYGAVRNRIMVYRTVAASLILLLLAPFASQFPDGLEWAAASVQLSMSESYPLFSLLKNYQVASIGDSMLSVMTAGILGAVMVWFVIIGVSKTRGRLVTGQ